MKIKKLYTIFFLVTIIFFMLFACYSYASKKKQDFIDRNKYVKINWEELYPFKNDATKLMITEKRTRLAEIYSLIKQRCKTYTSERLCGYYKFVEAARKYENILDWNMVSIFDYNAILRLHDGYLSEIVPSMDISQNANSTIVLAEFCREKNIDFFYINIPTKICISEDKNISGILDFSNQNSDRFLRILNEKHVKFYDMRKILHEDGLHHHKAFPVTDIHWASDTALWAAARIVKILYDDYKWPLNVDILKPENFRSEVYENFLGSGGTKLTKARAQAEDFSVLYPLFSTDLNYYVPSLGINTRGDFSIMYNKTYLEDREQYLYHAFNYSIKPLSKIRNLLLDNPDKKILFIHDSFMNIVIPFLSLVIKNIDEIDMRSFSGSIKSYINIEKPDVVVIAYYSGIPGDNRGKFFDFR